MSTQFHKKMNSILSTYANEQNSPKTSFISTPSEYMNTETTASPLSPRTFIGKAEIQSLEKVLLTSRNEQRKKKLQSTKFEMFQSSLYTSSKLNQKIKKKISFLTDEYINNSVRPNSFVINNPLTYHKENNNNKNTDDDFYKSLNHKEDNSYMKTVTLFGNYKPIRRYYVSNLNDIQGSFTNCKSRYKKKKNCFSPEPKENTAKSKENDELNSYRIFSYQSKGEKKNNKYAIKQF